MFGTGLKDQKANRVKFLEDKYSDSQSIIDSQQSLSSNSNRSFDLDVTSKLQTYSTQLRREEQRILEQEKWKDKMQTNNPQSQIENQQRDLFFSFSKDHLKQQQQKNHYCSHQKQGSALDINQLSEGSTADKECEEDLQQVLERSHNAIVSLNQHLQDKILTISKLQSANRSQKLQLQIQEAQIERQMSLIEHYMKQNKALSAAHGQSEGPDFETKRQSKSQICSVISLSCQSQKETNQCPKCLLHQTSKKGIEALLHEEQRYSRRLEAKFCQLQQKYSECIHKINFMGRGVGKALTTIRDTKQSDCHDFSSVKISSDKLFLLEEKNQQSGRLSNEISSRRVGRIRAVSLRKADPIQLTPQRAVNNKKEQKFSTVSTKLSTVDQKQVESESSSSPEKQEISTRLVKLQKMLCQMTELAAEGDLE